jgi:hypothetical protein
MPLQLQFPLVKSGSKPWYTAVHIKIAAMCSYGLYEFCSCPHPDWKITVFKASSHFQLSVPLPSTPRKVSQDNLFRQAQRLEDMLKVPDQTQDPGGCFTSTMIGLKDYLQKRTPGEMDWIYSWIGVPRILGDVHIISCYQYIIHVRVVNRLVIGGGGFWSLMMIRWYCFLMKITVFKVSFTCHRGLIFPLGLARIRHFPATQNCLCYVTMMSLGER